MYDIKFFEDAFPLKRQIVDGVYGTSDIGFLIQQLESMRSPVPYVFNLETSNYCNMRCVMCPRTSLMQRKNQWIDNADFERVLDQIVPHTPENLTRFWKFIEDKYAIRSNDCSENHFYFYTIAQCLTLHGFGEPLLDRYIVERIASCTRRNIPSYFSCTPANITVEKAEQLMENGLGVLKFSMDALTDEKAKFYRGPQNDFDKSFQTILDVLEMKARRNFSTLCVVVMIEMSEDAEMKTIVQNFVDLWKEKDIYFYIKNQDNRWYYDEDGNRATGDDLKGLVSDSHYNTQYCEFPWISLTVMANGDVVPCTQDYNLEMRFGNVREQSLADIWNSEGYRTFREYHVTGNFPEGHKCNERCDIRKAYQCLNKKTA